MNSISPQNFLKMLSNNVLNIIDIRNNYYFNKKHLPNSININENILLKAPYKYITKDETYFIICSKGISSKKVSNYLNSIGYKTISIKGGFSSLNFT